MDESQGKKGAAGSGGNCDSGKVRPPKIVNLNRPPPERIKESGHAQGQVREQAKTKPPQDTGGNKSGKK